MHFLWRVQHNDENTVFRSPIWGGIVILKIFFMCLRKILGPITMPHMDWLLVEYRNSVKSRNALFLEVFNV
eukprot:TRINITY_DN755_c0_g1_i1.p1 TRINITY_DN755_c0_g1~~TRINITY_DN755_c0_g1_i1.p1  ORF type:complete len:71 (-),score=6.44 TRINITY_DN755_c0_g1_i1:195-407(-)